MSSPESVMVELNLPPAELDIRQIDGQLFVFDSLRKKEILLTPEEWVRQHFMHLLINQYQFPKSLFRIETGLKYNQKLKRSDILVYDRSGKPWLLVECKAPEVKIDQKVFNQASVYNRTYECPYLAVTNGLQTFCSSIDFKSGKSALISDIPQFPAQ